MPENKDKKICEDLEKNPELINKLEPLDSFRIIGKVMELCLNNRYKLTSITPKWLMKRLTLDVNFVKNKLKQDFSLIFLFENYVSDMSFIRDEDLCNICIENKYLLSKDSPCFLRSNFPLFIHSLKAGSIKFEEIKLEKYLEYNIDDLVEIVLTADLCNYDSNIIKEMKNKVISHYFDYAEGKLYISNLNSDFCKAFRCFSNNINNIYLKDKFDLLNSEFINKITSEIKKSSKKINLVFSLGKNYIERDDLEKIVDKDIIFFESIEGVNRFSAQELLELDKILDLFVEDIKKSNLSQYEKYVAVYDIVKGFKEYKFYLENEKTDERISDQSRNVYLILLNDFIVCAGYIMLLNILLKKVGINSVYVSNSKENHALAYVNLEDPKYDINGYYKCDITADTTNDILNFGYNNIHEVAASVLFETDLDEYFIKDSSIPYSYLSKLDPNILEKMKESREREKQIFAEHLNKKINNKIPKEKLLEAIINVKEFVNKEKYVGDDRRKQKNLICLKNFSFNRLLDGFESDLLETERKMKKMLIDDCLKLALKNDYDSICYSNVLNKKLEEISFNPKFKYSYGSHIEDDKLLLHGGVPIEYKEKVIEALSELGINNFITITKDERFYFSIGIMDYISGMLVGEAISCMKNIIHNVNHSVLDNNSFSM